MQHFDVRSFLLIVKSEDAENGNVKTIMVFRCGTKLCGENKKRYPVLDK